ncbi:short-chain-acyl-CoA dehydrogenase [Besnoitia besnoiti]|uniref:Short/branched chain specific acyl-CoA dehydrogenase, mitochondrial n=1 Tax=Besnoitia besnoiti TaxID=94643 RepID=A0A2A9MMD5_BESBE|nr:short-chain-acyl-CoA dehydrogenase [Besnoitia besnoiti]PFH36720.1 short-chain-acyl-CoA dehydrogenase [Besnoitia besnoiti]
MRPASLHISKRLSRSFSSIPLRREELIRSSSLLTRASQGAAQTAESRPLLLGADSCRLGARELVKREERTGGLLSVDLSRWFSSAVASEEMSENADDKSLGAQMWAAAKDMEVLNDAEEDMSEDEDVEAEVRTNLKPLTLPAEDVATLREAVRRFAEEEIRPKVQAMDEAGTIDPDIIKSLFKQGYLSLEVDQKYGGSGMPFFNSLVVMEEISRVDPAVGTLVDIHNTLINRALMLYGTDEQKAKYLPQLASNTLGSFCLSESESGSDAFALKATARRSENGDAWVLQGTKQWISTAREAGLFLIFASYDLNEGYRGITAFLVDAGTPGLKVGRPLDKLGIKASSTCEVVLNDVQVPDSCVLGEVGEGYKVAMRLLNEGRIGIAAQMLGLAKGALDRAMQYINDRRQFGQRVADFQGVRFQFAQLATEIEAAHLLTYNAALLREAGVPFAKEAAMAKLKTSQVAQQVASAAVDFLGGNGFTKDFGVEKLYRDSKIGTIYEGTTNMQLHTIAKMMQKNYENMK